MTNPDERLRPHPSVRLAGSAVPMDLPATARALRAEPHPAKDGHRQVGLAHRGNVRMVLFAFDAGGHLPEHTAPGHVVLQALRGTLVVQTEEGDHTLEPGGALLLDPDVRHSVTARSASDLLLLVCLNGTPA